MTSFIVSFVIGHSYLKTVAPSFERWARCVAVLESEREYVFVGEEGGGGIGREP